jgi:hypothetical protein
VALYIAVAGGHESAPHDAATPSQSFSLPRGPLRHSMRRKATIVKGGTKQRVGLRALWPASMSSSDSSLQHAQKKRTAPQTAHKALKKMKKKNTAAHRRAEPHRTANRQWVLLKRQRERGRDCREVCIGLGFGRGWIFPGETKMDRDVEMKSTGEEESTETIRWKEAHPMRRRNCRHLKTVTLI